MDKLGQAIPFFIERLSSPWRFKCANIIDLDFKVSSLYIFFNFVLYSERPLSGGSTIVFIVRVCVCLSVTTDQVLHPINGNMNCSFI